MHPNAPQALPFSMGILGFFKHSLIAAACSWAALGAAHANAPQPQDDLRTMSAQAIAQAICQKDRRSEEVVGYWLERIAAHPELNAFISVEPEYALAQAKQEDARLAAGGACLPLGGVPIAIKDNIQVIGFANTAGTPALAQFHPQTNAPIIEKIQAAGAIIVGKTNMHELAFGVSGYNTAFHVPGTIGVRNAFNAQKISGGSSSGSAVALGARLIPIAMGTDTGGSTREPCALNGCVGFRPSVGRYSTEGVTPISFTRDTPGPMANTVGDVALLDTIITSALPLTPVAATSIRLGIPDYFWQDLEPEVAQQAQRALAQLRSAGVELVEVKMPHLGQLAADVATPIAIMEAKVALSDYLEQAHTGVAFEALAAGISSPDVQAIFAQMVTPGKVPGANHQMVDGQTPYAYAIEKGVPKLLALYQKTFADHQLDALVFPTVPQVAIDSNAQASRPEVFSRIIRNTDPSSNVGMPGLSIPIGLGAQSQLPIGMEIDGLPGTDAQLLAIGRTLESIWGPAAVAPIARP